MTDPGTLTCDNCNDGWGLRITSQTYHDDYAFEAYACEFCGATGTLTHDSLGTMLTGCLR